MNALRRFESYRHITCKRDGYTKYLSLCEKGRWNELTPEIKKLGRKNLVSRENNFAIYFNKTICKDVWFQIFTYNFQLSVSEVKLKKVIFVKKAKEWWKIWCSMNFLNSHIEYFPENLGTVSKEQGEDFTKILLLIAEMRWSKPKLLRYNLTIE